jgi:hypothetical protein
MKPTLHSHDMNIEDSSNICYDLAAPIEVGVTWRHSKLTSVSKTVLKFFTSNVRTWGEVKTPARAGEANNADIRIATYIATR